MSFCFDGDVPLYLEEDLHPKAAEFLFNDPSPSARHVLSAVLMSHEESLPGEHLTDYAVYIVLCRVNTGSLSD